AIMVGTGRGAEAGILFRGGEALERAHRVDTVVFDKTGTLTVGRPSVTAVELLGTITETEMLDLAASLEVGSEHPLGAAIVARARVDELGFRPVSAFEAVAGHGVQGLVDGRRVLVGTARLLADRGIATDSGDPVAERLAEDGRTPVWIAVEGRLAGLVAISDPVRPEAATAVAELRTAGIDVWLVTGDVLRTAEAVADLVGIPLDRVMAGVLPSDKSAKVEQLQSGGRVVAMVGDGVNDAPALARADVGIAIGSGAAVAIEAAGVTLVGGDPRGVAAAIALSRATMGIIRENLFWAFAYNIVLIPVAMGALLPFGIVLSPALAAAAMALSSVAVVTNSLRLRSFDAQPSAVRRAPQRGPLARLRRAWYLVAVAAASLAVAGGAIAADRAIDAGAVTIDVSARDLRFGPAEIAIPAGRFVILRFTNDDPVFHDWSVVGLANIDANARPGQTQRIRFRIDSPGDWTIVCTAAGHAEAGMTGRLVVRP
ncbi:MAG: P-type Cu+ transporter, partial [Chloroflexota bacterium]|nr:P-type Cu+ transporter [Chloroflexota bacterium]